MIDLRSGSWYAEDSSCALAGPCAMTVARRRGSSRPRGRSRVHRRRCKPLPQPHADADRDAAEPEPSQHRVRADRRPVQQPAAVHAARGGAREAGHDVHATTRSATRCAARRAPRSSPAATRTTTKIIINHGSAGGFFEFQKRGEDATPSRSPLHGTRLPHGLHGQVPQRATPRPTRARRPRRVDAAAGHLRPAGLGRSGTPSGNGYAQYNYLLNHDHHVKRHGHRPKDYLNTVLQRYGTSFITTPRRSTSRSCSRSPASPRTPRTRPRRRTSARSRRSPRRKAASIGKVRPTRPWLAGRHTVQRRHAPN